MHFVLCYARWDFFTVKQFDICCFRSVMRGLLQLSFELRRSFCINICCFIIRNNDSSVTILQKSHTLDTPDTPQFCAAPWPSFQKAGHVTTRDHWSCDHPIGDPSFAISRFWNFSNISIGDRDTPHSCTAPWPSLQKAGHVTTRDHWSGSVQQVRTQKIGRFWPPPPSYAWCTFGWPPPPYVLLADPPPPPVVGRKVRRRTHARYRVV